MTNGETGEAEFSRFLRVFGRHLVALCVTCRSNTTPGGTQGRRIFFNCPGVVISVRGEHFFLTAGHTLQQLEQDLQSASVEYEGSVLADTFGLDRRSDRPIPFDLPSHRMIPLYENGFDFGLIHLEDYYVRLLLRNEIRVVSTENIGRPDSITFSHYFMFGIPDELSSDTLSPSGEAFLGLALLNVRQLERLPEGLTVPPVAQFIGAISRDVPLRSLKGMSGGPIFGITQGDEIRYKVVALQSTWHRPTGTVAGTPVHLVISLIHGFMDHQEANRRSSQQ